MAEEAESASTPEKSKRKSKLPIIIGAVIILVLLGGGFYLFSNGSFNSSGPEVSVEPTLAPQETTTQANFTCNDDKTIEATFKNGAESSVDLVMSDGTTISLPRVESASGAKYANEDESIVFWNQGSEAFLEENGTQTYSDCVAEPSS